MVFVLDASAMIAFLRNEGGAAHVESALLGRDNRCLAHSLNLCEVFYDFHRSGGKSDAFGALQDLAAAGVVEIAEMTQAGSQPQS